MKQFLPPEQVIPAVLIVLGVLAVLVLVALVTAWSSIRRSKSLSRLAGERSEAAQQQIDELLQSQQGSQAKLDELSAQLLHIQQQPPPVAPPPKPGMNITKRSHALRLHRRGENCSQIAATLDLPVREVDLLLKVHQLIVSNV